MWAVVKSFWVELKTFILGDGLSEDIILGKLLAAVDTAAAALRCRLSACHTCIVCWLRIGYLHSELLHSGYQ